MRNPVTLLHDPLRPPGTGIPRELGDAFGADFTGDEDQDVSVRVPAVPAMGDLDRPDRADDADLIFDTAPRTTGDKRPEPVRDDRQQAGQPHSKIMRKRQRHHDHGATGQIPRGRGRRYLVGPAVPDLGAADRAGPDRAARLEAREVGYVLTDLSDHVATVAAMRDPPAVADPLQPRLPPQDSPLRVPDMSPGHTIVGRPIEGGGHMFRKVPSGTRRELRPRLWPPARRGLSRSTTRNSRTVTRSSLSRDA